MINSELKELIGKIKNISDGKNVRSNILEFQSIVLNCKGQIGNDQVIWQAIKELAIDLDYYESDNVTREEDPVYYGDEKLKMLITNFFDLCKNRGFLK